MGEPARQLDVDNNEPASGGITGKGWKAGQSGNPGGRPKGIARQAREAAGGDASKLLQVLLDVAADDSAKASDRIAAARELLDRGWGKAPAYEPVKDGDPLEHGEVESELARVVDELARQRAAKVSGRPETAAVGRARKNGAARARG
jgi:hypothetical protein